MPKYCTDVNRRLPAVKRCGCEAPKDNCCEQFKPTDATLSGLTGYWAGYNGTYALTPNEEPDECVFVFDSYTARGGCTTGSDYYQRVLDGAGGFIDNWWWLDGIRIEVEQSRVFGVNEGSILVQIHNNYYAQAVSGPGPCQGPSEDGPLFDADPIFQCLDAVTTYRIPYITGGMPEQINPFEGVDVILAKV